MDVFAAGDVRVRCQALLGTSDSAGDVVRWPYLAAPTTPIDERDIAAVAVRALSEDGHAGREYVLTGPQSLGQYEQTSTIGSVIGRSLRIEELSPDEAWREGSGRSQEDRHGCSWIGSQRTLRSFGRNLDVI